MKKVAIIAWIVLVIIIAIILIYYFLSPLSENREKNESNNTNQLANPASVFCIENNGTIEMRNNEQGQYGVCIINGKECDEWAFYRGEC
jgi:putative hemolysin